MNDEIVQKVLTKCALLKKCCLKCEWFGRSMNMQRMPAGECQLKPPGSFKVLEETVTQLGETRIHSSQKEVAVSFPPVWPWDKCRSFQECTKPSLFESPDAPPLSG